MTRSSSEYTILVRPSVEKQWVGGGSIRLTVYNLTDDDKNISTIEFDVAQGQAVSNNVGLVVTQQGQHVTGAVESYKRKIPAHGTNFVIVSYSGTLDPLPKNIKVDGVPADVPDYDTPPTPVTDLRVEKALGRSVLLDWTPSTDEVAVIEYQITVDVPGRDPVVVTGPPALVGRLTPGTDYEVTVVAMNIRGLLSDPVTIEFNSGAATGERPAWDIPVMPFIDYAGGNTVSGDWHINEITPIAQATGVRGVSLGFITVANDQMEPCWGSIPTYDAINGKHNADDVRAFKALGGRPVVSIGGWTNHIAEYVHTDVEKVYDWYSSILDAYEIDRIDFDIEGAAQKDKAFLARHIAIVLKLLDARPQLRISYTLPVDAGRERRPADVFGPDDPNCPVDLVAGFNTDGQAFIGMLADAGILPSLFNGMTMTMGNPNRPQGTEAVIATRFMHRTVKQAYPHLTDAEVWARLGACPMYGINDGGERFHEQDMHDLVAHARDVRLGSIGGWDAQRDWNSNRTTTKCGVDAGDISQCTWEPQTPGTYLKIEATYQN
ncbi:fibronectin type III domain-containing protein [Streptomyces hesseae]|uniref:Fibronectin type III domain-containing protein n=1 Tax=Streptomyces hesseae TaxID=3075519 RepID=A0ABU2SNQ1_9ACTN|nr:fibronectin type III domain-containing protein [Streptomyces sp. DSM 40473]MDT0450608.1 fibronectin type III domain-containing protein [Streptomyces sp. DSM 40473]